MGGGSLQPLKWPLKPHSKTAPLKHILGIIFCYNVRILRKGSAQLIDCLIAQIVQKNYTPEIDEQYKVNKSKSLNVVIGWLVGWMGGYKDC